MKSNERFFRKIGAEAILTTMILPVIAWMVISIIDLKNSYAKIETKGSFDSETIQEIKQDVKELKSFIITNGVKNGH
jgi:hypothetical protein